jgi:hypothetical protein
MTRRERRIRHYRVRRVFASVTALAVAGLGVGFAASAGAARGGVDKCYVTHYADDQRYEDIRIGEPAVDPHIDQHGDYLYYCD